MTFGLCCSQPAGRPHPASLPVRVPTVESLLHASFSFTSRLRLAFRYGCRHRLRLAPFIQLDSAHAGHTGARILARRPPFRWPQLAPTVAAEALTESHPNEKERDIPGSPNSALHSPAPQACPLFSAPPTARSSKSRPPHKTYSPQLARDHIDRPFRSPNQPFRLVRVAGQDHRFLAAYGDCLSRNQGRLA